jgi:asparagine synthase (glutamine-hydrolysing)
MSAFVLIYQRDGSPADPALLGNMMVALRHRGLDGQDVVHDQAVALGHQHFWTTPEEVGERQPLQSENPHLVVLFDGRLDNRDELRQALRLDDPASRSLSDAALILRAYAKWAEQTFPRLLGSFALVIYDGERRRVVCARDHLGDRSLFYYLDHRLLLIASEEQALLAHSAVSDELDETMLAYYFAVRVPSDGRTFFTGIRELLPAHAMTVTAEDVQIWRYWDAEPERRIVYRSDAEYGGHFRDLLDKSIQRCLRTVGRPGIMMSGGLDSTSVAALAARQLAAGDNPQRLYALSWIFDKFPTCDERSYMDPVVEQCSLDAIRVNGDTDWPLSEPFTLETYNPGRPDNDLYYSLKRRLCQTARDHGIRVLLTGAYGDELYEGAGDWLLDLLLERRFLEAGGELIRMTRKFGGRQMLASRTLRQVGGWLYDHIPGIHHLFGRRGGASLINQAAWLTPYASGLLPETDSWPSSAGRARRPDQHCLVLGLYGASGASFDVSMTNRLGVERRNPYRDRQLVEFMLAVPAHQLYRRQRYKHILRNSMAGLLPPSVLDRESITPLRPLYEYGLRQAEWSFVQKTLDDTGALWRRFVHSEWMETIVWEQLNKGISGREPLVPWYAVSLEIWLQLRRNEDSEWCNVNEK